MICIGYAAYTGRNTLAALLIGIGIVYGVLLWRLIKRDDLCRTILVVATFPIGMLLLGEDVKDFCGRSAGSAS